MMFIKENNIIGNITCLIICATLVLLVSCRSSPQVIFYTLNDRNKSYYESREGAGETVSVGVGSIRLPEYLDRPQIVTLKGVHQLHLSEFHRWAGRLEKEIGQVVAKNISLILKTPKTTTFPWESSQEPEYRVDFTFYHFEGTLGESFHAEGILHITGKGPSGGPVHIPFEQTVTIAGPGYEDLATASSKALWNLSEMASEKIRKNGQLSLRD